MIIAYKQIQAIDLQVELQRGQAVINMQDGAGDIGFHVDVKPWPEHGPGALTVEVSSGNPFYVNAAGEVTY